MMGSITRRVMMMTASLAPMLGRTAAWAQPAAAGAQPAPAPGVPDTDWRNYANDLASSRYAPLDQINAGNFSALEVAWRFNTASLGNRPDADFMATPLVVNGRLYTTAGFHRDVVCLDAATGELLWMYRKDEGARAGSRGGPGLGLSYWTDGTNERIVFVSISYYMISLDARTGLPDPGFGTGGTADLRLNDDQDINPTQGVIGLHAAPLIVKDVVVVGDAPTAAVKGYLRGFDVKTGQRKWIFHTIPRPGEFGYDTWLKAGQTDTIGNTGVWASMSADPELGLIYAGIELPGEDYTGFGRIGDALFSETLVALDVETGQRKWHYQFIHHGFQDRDVCCAAVLCDIPHQGRIVKALAQPSKQAYLYVLDRETGKPIWPIPEKPVPKGDVPIEWYAPTQPMPSRPPAYDRQGSSEADLNDWTPEINARAKAIAAHYRMGPLFTPPALFNPQGPWGTFSLPGNQGGANWPGASYDPDSHIVYVYSKTQAETFSVVQTGEGQYRDGPIYFVTNVSDSDGGAFGGSATYVGGAPPVQRRRSTVNDAIDAPIAQGLFSIEGLPLTKPPYGRITALDLSKGTLVWQVAHGETPDFIRNHPRLKGITIPRTGQAGILGTLTTKSLVICGDCGLFTDETGRKGARLRAYDKLTGEEKGTVFIDKVQTGAAMTYMRGGRQYIVTAIGGSHGAELVAFRLPAAKGAEAPPPPPPPA